jgi:hypothetical protein
MRPFLHGRPASGVQVPDNRPAKGSAVSYSLTVAGMSVYFRTLSEKCDGVRQTEASGRYTRRRLALEAVKTLVKLQDPSQPAAVRLGAARSIIEYGLKLREATEMAERIAALEEQLGVAV